MPKRVPEEELDALLAAMSRFPEGASIEQIAEAVQPQFPRRTLQRRLSALVLQKRVAVEGRGRASRYRVRPGRATVQAEPATLPFGASVSRAEAAIPLSDQGVEITHAVRKPVEMRSPVGYNRAFLDGYRPNETYYLPLQSS